MKLLQRIYEVGCRRRLSSNTIACYQSWVAQFLRFARIDGRWRTPAELGAREVEAFLTDLAVRRRLSASSQNQATCALVFLYRRVLADELGEDHLGRFAAERSRRPARVPTVLSAGEVRRLLDAMPPASMPRLMAELLYGCGLRAGECCTLRVRDVDFDRRQIVVRGGKGDKDRVVMLPVAAAARKVTRRGNSRLGGRAPGRRIGPRGLVGGMAGIRRRRREARGGPG